MCAFCAWLSRFICSIKRSHLCVRACVHVDGHRATPRSILNVEEDVVCFTRLFERTFYPLGKVQLCACRKSERKSVLKDRLPALPASMHCVPEHLPGMGEYAVRRRFHAACSSRTD